MGIKLCSPSDAISPYSEQSETLRLRMKVSNAMGFSNVQSILDVAEEKKLLTYLSGLLKDAPKTIGSFADLNSLVEEDLFVLSTKNNESSLKGFSTCFPSRWDPASKMGCSIFDLHQPVPHMSKMVVQVNRFLCGLVPIKAYYRVNWSLTDDPSMDQFKVIHPLSPHQFNSSNVLKNVYYRTEIQHFLRVPNSSLVVFAIRVRQCALLALPKDILRGLSVALKDWDEQMRQYKSWPIYGNILARKLNDI